jgi:hypothetical protein
MRIRNERAVGIIGSERRYDVAPGLVNWLTDNQIMKYDSMMKQLDIEYRAGQLLNRFIFGPIQRHEIFGPIKDED